MLYQNPEMGPIAPVYVSSGQLEEMYPGGEKKLSENILIHFEYSAVGVPPVRQGVPFVRRGVPLAIFR